MPAPYQLLAAHPALDFVNTLDNRFRDTPPVELMPSYADLLAFVADTGLLAPRQVASLRKGAETTGAATALAEAQALRETLATAFYSIAAQKPPAPGALRDLTGYVIDARAHQQLVFTKSGRSPATTQVCWQFAEDAPSVTLPTWALALCASELLTSDRLSLVRECSSSTCRWLFLDTSKNHSRRWCDMTLCGNREKARQFQARRKSAGGTRKGA